MHVLNHNLGLLCELWCSSTFLSSWPGLEAIPGSAGASVWDGQDELHPAGHPANITQLSLISEEMGCRNLLPAHELPSAAPQWTPPKGHQSLALCDFRTNAMKAFGLCKWRLLSQLQEKPLWQKAGRTISVGFIQRLVWDHSQAINWLIPWENLLWKSLQLQVFHCAVGHLSTPVSCPPMCSALTYQKGANLISLLVEIWKPVSCFNGASPNSLLSSAWILTINLSLLLSFLFPFPIPKLPYLQL